MQVEKRHIKCPHCNHEWDTKSQRIYTSCPNCRYNVHVQKNISPVSPYSGLEHLNLNQNFVRILDRNLKTEHSPNGMAVDVFFKQGKARCEYDDSSTCKHVEFALSLAVVQDIFKKKGWKL